jgi:hypothetical protein
MYWFEKESYKNFHAALLEDINALSPNGGFADSSYSNDACGSVMYEIDRDKETYVQLFAFEKKEEAVHEMGEEYGTQYAITVCRNGERLPISWEGDDRKEAMAQAIKSVEGLLEMGFVHEGIHIVNIKEDSSGFPHKCDDAIAEYRDTIASLVKESKPTDLDWLCLIVQNAIGQTDGGHAGVWWSGNHPDGILELGDDICSDAITDSIPDDILLEYIEYEIYCYFQEDK